MGIEEDKEELRALLREVHEALKDGRQLVKDMKTVRTELEQVSREVFEERMGEAVKACLDEYKTNMKTQIDSATQAVYDRFDTISNMLLYGNAKGRGENILETAAAKATQRREESHE